MTFQLEPQLYEPLTESSGWMAAMSPWTCLRSEGQDCSWYHGSWQYLRLLNLVSSPSWHSDFFLTSLLRHSTGKKSIEVLVCGCADYSLLAHVLNALGNRARVTVLDQCQTPLIASSWYSDRRGAERPALVQEDALDHLVEQAYDVVVSDAFLPRFQAGQLDSLLGAWKRSLKPGGAAISTVRIREETPGMASSHEPISESWGRVAREAAPWWPTVSDLAIPDLVRRAETFAQRQERTNFYSGETIDEQFREAGFTDINSSMSFVGGKRFAYIYAR